jgi:hypothetical protein
MAIQFEQPVRKAASVSLAVLAVMAAPWLAAAPASTVDPAVAAHQAGEPSLQEILDHLGYSIDTRHDEITAPTFVRARRGPVMLTPIAAFGLASICSAGWYVPQSSAPTAPAAGIAGAPGAGAPVSSTLWQVGAHDNKRYHPPLLKPGGTHFNPGGGPFGVWVATGGFPGEVIYSQDELQLLDPRFPSDDRHKAHVYPVRRHGRLAPNAYVIGWEYSTNDDNQDMVTLLTNAKPAASPNH